MKRFVFWLVIFAMWLLLFWSLDFWAIASGAVFALLISVFVVSVCPDNVQKILNLKRWFWVMVYIPYFFHYVVKANMDVALRVINPNLPIRPGIVKVKTSLTSEMAKTFLANSITLTPGTLTMDIDGQNLYVHWINIDTEDPKKRTAEICQRFEPLLRRIFE